jgi:hypothetical protein
MSSAEHPDGNLNDGTDSDQFRVSGSVVGEYHIGTEKASDAIGWGRWTAVERSTGKRASGPIEAIALLILIVLVALDSDHETETASDPDVVWRETTAETKRRFDEENVTEDDVEDAIEWARSR